MVWWRVDDGVLFDGMGDRLSMDSGSVVGIEVILVLVLLVSLVFFGLV